MPDAAAVGRRPLAVQNLHHIIAVGNRFGQLAHPVPRPLANQGTLAGINRAAGAAVAAAAARLHFHKYQTIAIPAHQIKLTAPRRLPVSPQDGAALRTQQGCRRQFSVRTKPFGIPPGLVRRRAVPSVKQVQTSGDATGKAHASAGPPCELSCHIPCVLQNRTADKEDPLLPSSCRA